MSNIRKLEVKQLIKKNCNGRIVVIRWNSEDKEMWPCKYTCKYTWKYIEHYKMHIL